MAATIYPLEWMSQAYGGKFCRQNARHWGMMVSSTFNPRIEPGLNATSKPAGTWWYRHGGQGSGPVTDEYMRALIDQKDIDRSTMVWCTEFGDNWKRLDETSLWKQPSAPPALDQPVSAGWQKTFDLFEAEAQESSSAPASASEKIKKNWRMGSFLGFLFGPFYYFYLGMWRKGIWICALLPLIVLVQDMTSKAGVLDIIIPVFCSLYVKRDYFRYRVRGETIWPSVAFSKNVWTDAGIALATLIICVGAIIAFDEDSSSASANSGSITRDASLDLMSVQKKHFISSTGRMSDDDQILVFTSKTSSIDFKSVSVNRGNCRMQNTAPQTLAFGQTKEIWVLCNPIEATVQTDRGSFTVTWNR